MLWFLIGVMWLGTFLNTWLLAVSGDPIVLVLTVYCWVTTVVHTAMAWEYL